MTSTRLPGKVMLPLSGKPALERMIERIRPSRYVDDIVIASPVGGAQEPIVELAKNCGVKIFQGSEEDVLGRVLGAVRSVSGDIIVELTGDCPLLDHRLIDEGLEEYFNSGADYAANNTIPPITFPNGFDVQVFSVKALEEVGRLTIDPIDRLHVSLYIYRHPERFKLHRWSAGPEVFGPDLRLTMDEDKDYELISAVFQRLLPNNPDFSTSDVVRLIRENPELAQINESVRQKEIHEE